MQTLVKDSQIKACFQQLKQMRPINIKNIQAIIDKYHPIAIPALDPLKMFNPNSNSSKKITQITNLEQQFYQEKFVPSPDLMASYQQTYIKSLRGEQPSVLTNNRLRQFYVTSNESNKNVNPYAFKSNVSAVPVSNSYINLSSQYNNFPVQAQNKRVFIEQKQEKLLKQLNAKQKSTIQMSIPVIEKSLMEYEIRNLQNKNIVLENYGKLDKWKSKRQQFESKFNQNR